MSLFEKYDQVLNQAEFDHADLRRLKIELKQYFDDLTTRLISVRLTSDIEKENLEFISLNSAQIDQSIKSPFINGATLKAMDCRQVPTSKKF